MISRSPHAPLLRFIFSQSYAKSIADTGRAAPAIRVPGLAGDEAAIPLDWHAAGSLGALPYPPAPSPAPAPSGEQHRRALAALLHGGLGVLRVEPANPFNPHRGYPSARALFPVHAYLLGGPGALHYDPIGHRLQPVAGGGAPAWSGAAIALAGCAGTFPEGYGPLRYALTALEAGHALANLVLLGTALGLAPTVQLAFSDRALLEQLALPRDGSWAPLAIVSLGAALPEPPPPPPPPSPPPSPSPSPDDVAEIERATWLDGPDAAAWRTAAGLVRDPTARSAGDTQALPPRSNPDRPRSVGDVLFARNAGRTAGGGLCGRAAPIPADVLHAAAAALRPPPLDLATPGASPSGVRAFVVAERVAGLPDGIYELAPDRAALAVVRRGRFLDAVQRGFTYAPAAINIRSMNLAWLLAVDYPAVLARWGARGLRLANLELGWLAQGVSCAAAAHGLFARPVRSFREPVLDELLNLGPTEMIGYEILCGSNRFSDFVFDLRPPP